MPSAVERAVYLERALQELYEFVVTELDRDPVSLPEYIAQDDIRKLIEADPGVMAWGGPQGRVLAAGPLADAPDPATMSQATWASLRDR